jgi:hypothetical protein
MARGTIFWYLRRIALNVNHGLQILSLVGVALDSVAVYSGLGRHEEYLSTYRIIQAIKYKFLAISFNLMSSALAKCSICIFPIYVNQNGIPARILTATSVLLIIFALATITVLFARCTPVAALWTPSLRAGGACIDANVNTDVGLTQSSE